MEIPFEYFMFIYNIKIGVSNSMASDWSIDLEHDEYETNKDLIINDAIEAIYKTAPGHFVNLFTANSHGHPNDYLTPILKKQFKGKIETKFIDQCGCGGYVLRVWLNGN